MNLLELLHAGDWLGQMELVDLFRLGHRESDARDRHETIRILDDRFNLAEKRHISAGVLLDGVNWLATRSYDDRFEYVMDLMRAASKLEAGPLWPDRDVADSIADLCDDRLPVQFSFERALPSCLIYAKRIKESADGILGRHQLDSVRYAGMGEEVPMLAYAGLYLGLPIRVEQNLPWEDCEAVDERGSPHELPRLSVSMPPPTHKANGNLELVQSAKKTGLPRMVDRDRIDVESASLFHEAGGEYPSLVFVSADALSATRQSKLAVRRTLRKSQVVRRIVEIAKPTSSKMPLPAFVVELGSVDSPGKAVTMAKVENLEKSGLFDRQGREFQGKAQTVPFLDIETNGDNFSPSRYLAKSTRRSVGLADAFNLVRTPERVRLADVFEVIRPKILRHDANGDQEIYEVGVQDISDQGVISMPPRRKLSIRSTLVPNIEPQRARPRDILFVHRTNIGRVAYVDAKGLPFLINRGLFNESYELRQDWPWISQGITILRARRRSINDVDQRRCDPRLLYMFLLAHGIGGNWREKASGRSSPAVPIGEVERFAIPIELVEGAVDPDGTDYTQDRREVSEALLRKFEERREGIEDVVRLETKMLRDLTYIQKQFY